MLNVTPFYNPFKKIEKICGKTVVTVEINGKTYKKIAKNVN